MASSPGRSWRSTAAEVSSSRRAAEPPAVRDPVAVVGGALGSVGPAVRAAVTGRPPWVRRPAAIAASRGGSALRERAGFRPVVRMRRSRRCRGTPWLTARSAHARVRGASAGALSLHADQCVLAQPSGGFFGILGKQSLSMADFYSKAALREHLTAYMRAWNRSRRRSRGRNRPRDHPFTPSDA